MTFIKGVQTEAFYAFGGASTDLATFTAEDNLQKTYPACAIPGGQIVGGGSASRSFRVKGAGRVSTFTSGTFTISARLLTTETWSAGGILLGATPAITMTASITLAMWFLDLDFTIRTESIGAASTVVTTGEVRCPKAIASPFASTIPDTNVAPTVATVDVQSTYYLFLSAACSVSNAANLINLQQLKVWGEN